MLKKLFFKTAKKSVFITWWSIIAAAILIYFCYYGVFPNNNT